MILYIFEFGPVYPFSRQVDLLEKFSINVMYIYYVLSEINNTVKDDWSEHRLWHYFINVIVCI